MEKPRDKYIFHPDFESHMKSLLGDEEYKKYLKFALSYPLNSIRCNTLKINPEELKKRLEKKWKVVQPYNEYPEIMVINQQLAPGELGKAEEHILGYYYIQEISSMLPILALNPSENDVFLDLCASPGSKTTQAASMMKNKGAIIANDVNIGRIAILSANLQRCSVTNSIITRNEGTYLCNRLAKNHFTFDKILADVPCSCQGTTRSSPKTVCEFSENLIKKLSNTQKQLALNALKVLKIGGEMIYSTCTYSPEENEEVVSYLLDNFPVEIKTINLPLKTQQGIDKWKEKTYNKDVKKCIRIYPQDNDTEGFFIAKLQKTGEIK